jgi:CheY-like chemotaxis protein
MPDTLAQRNDTTDELRDDRRSGLPVNILIVDDLPEKLLVYETILEEMGHNLVTATSGEEALR